MRLEIGLYAFWFAATRHYSLDMADDHDYPHQVEVSDDEVSSSEDLDSSDLDESAVEQIEVVSIPLASPTPAASIQRNSPGVPRGDHPQNPPRAAKNSNRAPRNLDVDVSGPTEDVRTFTHSCR